MRHNKQESNLIDQASSVKESYTEYAVDALALKTDEGRGDRRNVQGELLASEEP